jgi:RNA-directed DNA polymerase
MCGDIPQMLWLEANKAGFSLPQTVCTYSKAKGCRPLGIPAVKDRVIQAALKLMIETTFEHEFEPRSFGFRQGFGCKDALRKVDRRLKAGYCWVVNAELQSYFDTIPHAALPEKVGNRIAEGRLLALIGQFLRKENHKLVIL